MVQQQIMYAESDTCMVCCWAYILCKENCKHELLLQFILYMHLIQIFCSIRTKQMLL